MTPLLTPILAMLLLGQVAVDQPAAGEVVDDQGKPIADGQVVLYSPPTGYGKGTSVEVRTTSDAQGKFSLIVPGFERVYVNGVHFFAYRPGWALTARPYGRPPYRLVLEKPRPRTIKVEGPDGRPIAGARVAVRVMRVFGSASPSADVPRSLADLLATTTGPDGQATINTIAGRDQLVAVRVTADAIGTQDILLTKALGRASEESVITIKLKPTSHFAGRIVDKDGQPVAGQSVEVWSRGNAMWLAANTVELSGGPLRSAADGSFQTPDNLMAGSAYRVSVRAPGQEPTLSEWITIGEKPRTLPLLVQRPMRSISGRVVDRQGKPLANVKVFQIRPELYLFLALGSKPRDESASREAFQAGLNGIDKQLRKAPGALFSQGGRAVADRRAHRSESGARALLARRVLAASRRQSAQRRQRFSDVSDYATRPVRPRRRRRSVRAEP